MSIPEVDSINRLLAFLEKNVRSLANLNYRGPGAVVGARRYTSAGETSFSSTSTSLEYVDGAGDKVSLTFEAPPSGIVEVDCSVMCNTAADRYGILGLSDNGSSWATYTPIGDPTDTTVRVFYADNTDIPYATVRWVLPGLTPGQSYTFYLGFATNNADGAFNVRWGSYWGSLIFKATALPATTVLTTS